MNDAEYEERKLDFPPIKSYIDPNANIAWKLCLVVSCVAIIAVPIYLLLRALIIDFRKQKKVEPEPADDVSLKSEEPAPPPTPPEEEPPPPPPPPPPTPPPPPPPQKEPAHVPITFKATPQPAPPIRREEGHVPITFEAKPQPPPSLSSLPSIPKEAAHLPITFATKPQPPTPIRNEEAHVPITFATKPQPPQPPLQQSGHVAIAFNAQKSVIKRKPMIRQSSEEALVPIKFDTKPVSEAEKRKHVTIKSNITRAPIRSQKDPNLKSMYMVVQKAQENSKGNLQQPIQEGVLSRVIQSDPPSRNITEEVTIETVDTPSSASGSGSSGSGRLRKRRKHKKKQSLPKVTEKRRRRQESPVTQSPIRASKKHPVDSAHTSSTHEHGHSQSPTIPPEQQHGHKKTKRKKSKPIPVDVIFEQQQPSGSGSKVERDPLHFPVHSKGVATVAKRSHSSSPRKASSLSPTGQGQDSGGGRRRRTPDLSPVKRGKLEDAQKDGVEKEAYAYVRRASPSPQSVGPRPGVPPFHKWTSNAKYCECEKGKEEGLKGKKDPEKAKEADQEQRKASGSKKKPELEDDRRRSKNSGVEGGKRKKRAKKSKILTKPSTEGSNKKREEKWE